MDFEDSREEAAFRAEVRTWLDANAKPQRQARGGRSARRALDDGAAMQMARASLAEDQGRGRLCPHHLAQGHGRHRRHADAEHHLRPGRVQIRRASGGAVRHRSGHVHPDPDDLWRRRGEEALRQAGGAGRRDLVPAVLRTGGRLRRRRSAHDAREKDGDTWTINGSKIWTTGAQFSDYGIIAHPHRPQCAQAQGSDDVLSVDEGPGRRRPADQAGVAAARASTRSSSPT